MNKKNFLNFLFAIFFVLVFSPRFGWAASDFSSVLLSPLSSAMERVTKKPFGIYVSPQNSPVYPEKFTGYHTGVDFEILPGEENQDVPVAAVCSGTLAYKGNVSGYGGVAVERCKINGEDATVVYGHLKPSSITYRINNDVMTGDKIAVLGKGYSPETDGERKHLHLGIHKGTDIDLRGYVKTPQELEQWLDVSRYMVL